MFVFFSYITQFQNSKCVFIIVPMNASRVTDGKYRTIYDMKQCISPTNTADLRLFYQGHGLNTTSGHCDIGSHRTIRRFHKNHIRVDKMSSVFQKRSHIRASNTHSLRHSKSNVPFLWHITLCWNERLLGNSVWHATSWARSL